MSSQIVREGKKVSSSSGREKKARRSLNSGELALDLAVSGDAASTSYQGEPASCSSEGFYICGGATSARKRGE